MVHRALFWGQLYSACTSLTLPNVTFRLVRLIVKRANASVMYVAYASMRGTQCEVTSSDNEFVTAGSRVVQEVSLTAHEWVSHIIDHQPP